MTSFLLLPAGEDVLAGREIDPTFCPVIYGAGQDDDWTDEEVWAKSGPSSGTTVGIDEVRAACESAKQNPAEETPSGSCGRISG